MATAPSSSSSVFTSSSTNRTPSIKQEPLPKDASIEFIGGKAVKAESMEELREVKMEDVVVEEDPYAFLNSREHMDKFKRYEADLKRQLMQKYFSERTIFGGNIFDVKINIEGETITASRSPQYQSYVDPVGFDDLISNRRSPPSAETTPPPESTLNEKPPST